MGTYISSKNEVSYTFDYMGEPREYTDLVSLYYDPRSNRFEDEDGFIVWSIFELITPNDVYLFRENQEYMIVPHRQLKGVGVELYYPEEGDCWYCENYEVCHGYIDLEKDEGEDFESEHHYQHSLAQR